MASLLFNPPMPCYAPAEAVALKSAELDVHNAAMEILKEIREGLAPSIKDSAYPAATIGLTSALGRILAMAPDQQAVSTVIFQLSQLVAAEHRYWLNHRALLH